MPIILLLGPQGAGKGTQARLLSLLTGWQHLDAGSLLRSKAEEPTEEGQHLKTLLAQGRLVPDELVTKLVLTRITPTTILDGYPRSLHQYALYTHHGGRIDQAYYIHITDEEAVRRLSQRRVCTSPEGEWTFILGDREAEERCRKSGGRIVQREDDTPEAIRTRLKLYHQQTQPLLTKLEEDGILHRVNGEQPIPSVFKDILTHLSRILHQPIPGVNI